MCPVIKSLTEKKLAGKKITTTFANNQTRQLWQSFMPNRKEITNSIGTDLFSLQAYPPTFDFNTFDQWIPFEKWAALEVADFHNIPEGMETCILPGGLYAVFYYKGLSTDTSIFQYIFGTWLPDSKEYTIDHRPHFEILGEKYKNIDPDSEEEIWIPVKLKH